MHLNPFDLKGPEFLVFYTVVGIATLAWARIRMESEELRWPVPRLNMSDPYEIAYLRGGKDEALRVAAVSLVDRGLLDARGGILTAVPGTSGQVVRRAIEKSILLAFRTPGKMSAIHSDNALSAACEEYRRSLSSHKLIASEDVMAQRRTFVWPAAIVLLVLAALKTWIALTRGRHNIGFLVFLALGFTYVLAKAYGKERTALGDRFLQDLTKLFEGLKQRSTLLRPGGYTNELALLAAVFGIGVLSESIFPSLRELFPTPSSSNGSSDWSSGSSCSSSSCSSGCGGGGCGGGCGGCGS